MMASRQALCLMAVFSYCLLLAHAFHRPHLSPLRSRLMKITASSDSSESLTVPQLKKALRSQGLPVSGTKAVLQKRLRDAEIEEEEPKTSVSLKQALHEAAQKEQQAEKKQEREYAKTDKENFMEGTGRWTPLNSKAAIFSSEDDEDEDPYGDPFFTSSEPNPNEWGGSAAGGDGAAEELDDWNEEANYFDEDEEEPDYSGYSKDKSRGREVGNVKKGSSSLFPSRADYAAMTESREATWMENKPQGTATKKSYGFSSGYKASQASVAAPAPAPASTLASVEATTDSVAPVSETGIELGSGGTLEVEVIPPAALKSLLELEDRVTVLSSDVKELKIVNAALLIALFTVVYQFTRPIW